jgi:hypothetical protein
MPGTASTFLDRSILQAQRDPSVLIDLIEPSVLAGSYLTYFIDLRSTKQSPAEIPSVATTFSHSGPRGTRKPGDAVVTRILDHPVLEEKARLATLFNESNSGTS